jgi:hypothetical protein
VVQGQLVEEDERPAAKAVGNDRSDHLHLRALVARTIVRAHIARREGDRSFLVYGAESGKRALLLCLGIRMRTLTAAVVQPASPLSCLLLVHGSTVTVTVNSHNAHRGDFFASGHNFARDLKPVL